jgi:hypothetical protein
LRPQLVLRPIRFSSGEYVLELSCERVTRTVSLIFEVDEKNGTGHAHEPEKNDMTMPRYQGASR